jgi:DNA-binding beta-propeller fold protein YncE
MNTAILCEKMSVISHINKRIPVNYFAAALFFFILLFAIHTTYAQRDDIVYLDSITLNEDEKKLSLPSSVMPDAETDEIYVVNGSGNVIVYTSDFFPLFTLNKKRGIEAAQGLAMDSRRNLYVPQAATKDSPRPRISVLSSCLRWKKDIYISGFEGADSFAPYRVAISKEGVIYAAARNYPGVLILDSEGAFIDKIHPEENGRRVKITNVTLDKAGKIYLVSEEEGRIYVYDQNREMILKFGEKGGSSGKLSRPKSVGIDEHRGMIYVADYMRHTITVYDSSGSYLFEFGGLGWTPGWFQHPMEIAVDRSGRVLVADFFNHRIQVFRNRMQ